MSQFSKTYSRIFSYLSPWHISISAVQLFARPINSIWKWTNKSLCEFETFKYRQHIYDSWTFRLHSNVDGRLKNIITNFALRSLPIPHSVWHTNTHTHTLFLCFIQKRIAVLWIPYRLCVHHLVCVSMWQITFSSVQIQMNSLHALVVCKTICVSVLVRLFSLNEFVYIACNNCVVVRIAHTFVCFAVENRFRFWYCCWSIWKSSVWSVARCTLLS